MPASEVAALQVDRVHVVVRSEWRAAATHHFQRGPGLQDLCFQNIREKVKECLDPDDDVDVLLLCLPRKDHPQNELPIVIPQEGCEMRMMDRISACVDEDTCTLHLEARMFKPSWFCEMPAPAGLQVGGDQYLSAIGREPDQEPGTSHDDAEESDEYYEILDSLPHNHLLGKIQRGNPSNKEHCGYQLLYAADDGCVGCVRYLLRHAVIDINYRSLTRGWTPLDFAWDSSRSDVMYLLVSHGGVCRTRLGDN